MKKHHKYKLPRLRLSKIPLKMKLTTLFLVVSMLQVQANSYSQKTKISLDLENVTINTIFSEIEDISEFRFLFETGLIDLERKTSIKVNNKKISQVLSELFNDKPNIEYKIRGRQIILRKIEQNITVPKPEVINEPSNPKSILQQQVSGTVTDSDGLLLPGASVVEKGTTNGTQTDFDGNFTLTVSEPDVILIVSYIGYSTQEIAVNGQNTVSIVLKESAAGLDEVIVVGYGTQTKKDLTGSVTVLDGDDIVSRSTTNVSNALQGAVAGVSVTRSSSAPGATNDILVRGVTTLQGNSSPLILVDNVPVNSIDDVNPDQIESISVLKDAAAASIYGSRGAAGVIIVTTKRAKSGVFSLGYSGEYIVNTPTEFRKTVGAVQYMQMDNEKAWNDNGNGDNQFPTWPEDLVENYPANNAINPDQFPDTDWRNLILRKSSSAYRHNITMSGGTEKVRTNVNFGYEYQDALYDGRDWKRYVARVNNDIQITDKFGATVDFSLRVTRDDQPVVDPTQRAIGSGPIYAALWQDGRIAESKSGDNVYARLQEGGFQENDNYLFYGMASVYYKATEALKLTLNLAPNFEFNQFKNFNKSIPFWAFDDPNQNAEPQYISGHNINQTNLTERRRNDNTLTTQALVNYDKVFGGHNVSAVAGYEEFSARSEVLGVQGIEFVSNDFSFLNQAPLDRVFNDNSSQGTSFAENAYSSYFGRLAYNYNNKYYLQGTVRRDGSSRFGKDFRWGTFPSVSAGWVVSNEDFMEGLSSAISFLKFRGSYGTLGNDRLGNYLYLSVLQFSNSLIANSSNVEAVRAAAQRFLAIEDVSWETTSTLNLGVDLNMFENKLSLTADYFEKQTTDMLLDLSIPALSGYENPTVNVGSMDTNGWELGVSWRDQIGGFKYSASFNVFDSESIIGDISGKRLFSNGERLLSEEGSEFRSWYGFESDGIFQTQAEVDSSPVINDAVAPGDVKYKDLSGPEGVPDGIINELDRTILGGSLPRYQYGGNINMAYKNFDFGLVFQGVGEQSFYLSQNLIRPFQESWLSPSTVYAGDYWSVNNTAVQNQSVRYPRLTENSAGNNYAFSDFWLVDGSYLRIKNITVGYSLPSSIFGEKGLSNLRIYLSGNDVLTFDNLIEGVDPEQVGGGGYLITQSFILGIKANF
jgi:TonB-linked SusC/RagA family outer membrane protein